MDKAIMNTNEILCFIVVSVFLLGLGTFLSYEYGKKWIWTALIFCYITGYAFGWSMGDRRYKDASKALEAGLEAPTDGEKEAYLRGVEWGKRSH